MINYFKAAERLLSERGNLEKALANLERRRDRVIKQNGPGDLPSIDYSRPYISTSASADALSACLELTEIVNEINDTREMIAEIDDVLGQLEETDASLLRAWYIERKPKEEIAATLNYASATTVYDLRNQAVARFAVLYYGGGAIAST